MGSLAFQNLVNHVEIRESVMKNFHTFIAAMVHELCHLVLHSSYHELRESEVATDLCVLIMGFGEVYRKAKHYHDLGYLTHDQLHKANAYTHYLRTHPPARTVTFRKPGSHVANFLLKQINDLFK